MTDELKPCPLCGGAIEISDRATGGYGISCDNGRCSLCLATIFVSKEEATDCWNTRPIEDELNAKIVQLQNEHAQKMHELQDRENKLAEVLEWTFRSLCAFLDYCSDSEYKCYDPKGATNAARKTLAEYRGEK